MPGIEHAGGKWPQATPSRFKYAQPGLSKGALIKNADPLIGYKHQIEFELGVDYTKSDAQKLRKAKKLARQLKALGQRYPAWLLAVLVALEGTQWLMDPAAHVVVQRHNGFGRSGSCGGATGAKANRAPPTLCSSSTYNEDGSDIPAPLPADNLYGMMTNTQFCSGGQCLWRTDEIYERSAGNQNAPAPYGHVQDDTDIDDRAFMPEPWPEYLPFGKTVSITRPITWAMAANMPDAEDFPESSRRGQPRLRPRPRPSLGTQVSVSVGVRGAKLKTRHVRVEQQPPRRKREHKWSGAYASSFLPVLFDGITELADFVEAIHDALPEHCKVRGKLARGSRAVRRGKSKSVSGGLSEAAIYAMAKAIVNCPEGPDMGKAIKNLVANEIGDRILGRFIGSTKRRAVGAGINPGAVRIF